MTLPAPSSFGPEWCVCNSDDDHANQSHECQRFVVGEGSWIDGIPIFCSVCGHRPGCHDDSTAYAKTMARLIAMGMV